MFFNNADLLRRQIKLGSLVDPGQFPNIKGLLVMPKQA
jgi:hypothetical protein